MQTLKKYVIHGGKPLYGKVEISGAKNAAVGIIPAALLVEGTCRIENIPQISDVTLMLNILQELGASVRTLNRSTVEVDASAICKDFLQIPGKDLPSLRRLQKVCKGVSQAGKICLRVVFHIFLIARQQP